MLPIPEFDSVARAVVAVFRLHEQRPLVFLLDDARVIGQYINAVVVDLGKVTVIEQKLSAQPADLTATRAGIESI